MLMSIEQKQQRINSACNEERSHYYTSEALRIQKVKLTAYVNGVLAEVYPYNKVRFLFSLNQIKKINSKIFKHKN